MATAALLGHGLGGLFHQPSWFTLLHVLRLLSLGDLSSSELLPRALLFEAGLRLSLASALLLHEGAHLAAAAIFLPASSWRLARVHVRGLLFSLAPAAPVPTCHVALPVSLPAAQDLLVRSAGLLASLGLSLLALSVEVGEALRAGVVLSLLGAMLSDLPTGPLLGARAPAGVFCCGNWGLLLSREALEERVARSEGPLPSSCEALLKSVLEIVELRGAQAGGCLTFLGARGGQVEAVRARTVKSKRGHLGSMLFRRFKRELAWHRLLGGLQRLPVILVQGHSRFGTSSSPAVCETHPHQWLGRHVERVWRCTAEGWWSSKREAVCTTITHNGDYDGSVLYDSTVPNGLLGEWLARVLHGRNTAKGDSPKLAGMMDLLLCQGMWPAAVRCAFVFRVLHHVDEAFGWEAAGPSAPSSVPSQKVFEEWAGAFEEAFEQITASSPLPPTPENVQLVAAGAALRLACMSKEAARLLQKWGLTGEALTGFCGEAAKLFFQRDLLAAVHAFFAGAVGTFSVSVSCSLWPESIVMAARGQPISIAFDAEQALAYWSSEPNSLDVPNTSKIAGASRRVAAARWDMDDAQGEAIELRTVRASAPPEEILGVLPGCCAKATFFNLPGSPARSSRIVVRGMNLEKKPTALDRAAFMARWVRLRSPPPARLPRGATDPIAADLMEVPAVLKELEDSWSDPAALNHVSGSRFARCLQELLCEPQGDPQDLDVLIFGIENSLWLAQQFAADLSRLFPRLNVTALSANWVLGLLQKAQGQIEPLNFALPRERFAFKKGAIALAVSHSGTTYPTVWCARLLAERPEGLRLFAMSGVLESVLANSVGQGQTKQEFSGTLFSTMAGVRPAEPSTVATLAMHHSFSLLLLMCAKVVATAQFEKEVSRRRLAALFYSSPPTLALERTGHSTASLSGGQPETLAAEAPAAKSESACCLQPGDVEDFQRVVEALLPAAEQLCGVSREHEPLVSQPREELLRLGAYFSSQLLEGWYSTLLAALYVYVTVTFGLPLFSSVWAAAKQGPLEEVDWELSGRTTLLEAVVEAVVGFLDAHLYVFLAALVATAHRLATRRRLFTRYTNRSIVVVESTANYKLLRAYVSKLGALAFRFTAFGVSGQNGLDHFVHEMTHRTTSEVILFVGRPDGRMGTLAAAERAVVLSIQQARFVASSAYTGIEMVSLGHNPWRKEGLCVRDVVLPSDYRPDFLSCQLLQSSEGPQDPLDVCHRLATLGGEKLAPTNEAPFRWVSKEMAQSEMGSQQHVDSELASCILLRFVEQNAQALDIEGQDFDICKVLQPSAPALPPSPSSSPTSPVTPRKTPRAAEPAEGFSAADLVAILRGRAMAEEIRRLQQRRLRGSVGAGPQVDLNVEAAREVFEAWVCFVRERDGERLAKKGGRKVLQMPCAEWRVQEEYRRRRRQWLNSYKTSKYGLRACFQSWRKEVQAQRELALAAQSPVKAYFSRSVSPGGEVLSPMKEYFQRSMSPSKDYLAKDFAACNTGFSRFSSGEVSEARASAPVGSRRLRKISNHEDLVAQLAVMERLYETRTAAAERLLAAFVVFHRAVKPVSRLWGLSFDMDRSESRLRVASTPAPVAFVEALKGGRVFEI